MKKLKIILNGCSWAWIAHLAVKYNLELTMDEQIAQLQGADDYSSFIQEVVDTNKEAVCEII